MGVPWYQETVTGETQILSSRIRLARNIKKYPFHQKLSAQDAYAMIDEITESVVHANNHKFFHQLNIQALSNTERSVFLEKHIVSFELLQGNLPKGLLISDDQNISVMLNEEDHIRIQSIQAGEGMSTAYEVANRIDDLIEERMEFAFHVDYGYLTACPTNVGTGMRASYMIHLPCIEKSGKMKELLPKITKFGIELRGIYGEGTDSIGDIHQISNRTTLGKSEEDIIQGLQNVTKIVLEQEMQARENMLVTQRSALEDSIYRAYGLLKHSRIISSKEAMAHLSNVRLGYSMGLLTEQHPPKQIYQIMMEIQSGHLQRLAGREMQEQERDIARASYLREIFSKVV